ncbi:hypothetical protein [Salisediminibacterium beveridgei]|uniref:Uncharacterized protein n=1 Tax=Salisediminibacterium beveridgei TaxID=632773 RepID=A0A1D7R078_9BACI|nr:hypothetical protein [Salisediminibacterium beveridgei]AOM84667.1 hypothetical protein BBEV_3373 [Salisediminibacterium beveridgei]
MTIDDYLHAFERRLTYLSDKERRKVKGDIRQELEQIKEDVKIHENVDEKNAEYQAVASYLSPADMAKEINDQYFESIDEQFSGQSFSFAFIMYAIYSPLGILFLPFVYGTTAQIVDRIIPYLTFMIIAGVILFFYFPKHITSEQIRTLRQHFIVINWVPALFVIAYLLNFFRSEGMTASLTLYLGISLMIWLIIYIGIRTFYNRQLHKPL